MKKLFILLAAAVMAAACSKELPAVQDETPVKSESVFVEGEIEVKFTEDMIALIEADMTKGSLTTKSSSLNDFISELGVTSMERVFPYAGEYEERTRREGLHRFYKVRYNPELAQTKVKSSLGGLEGVENFEFVRRIRPTAIFNDPTFPQQWHYFNDGKSKGYKAGCDVNVVPVWNEYTKGDPKVVVCVVDEGIDYEHEDLMDAYAGGYNWCLRNSQIHPGDHGSHVAGTIAAINNNSLGVCGIAGGDAQAGIKGVRVLSAQVFDTDSKGEDISGDNASAIKWGADNGAVISQNSWGYVFKKEEDAKASAISASLKAAIDYFIKYAGCDNSGNQKPGSPMKGGLVVFAAGNDGYRYNPICEYEPVLTVGALAADFNRAYYSNYSNNEDNWVDICAPGGDAEKGQMIYSCIAKGYGRMQGTSMACPHVSGVAALVVSYCGGPGFTASRLREMLEKSANTKSVQPGQRIGGLVDALGAINYGSTAVPAKVTSVSSEAVSNNISCTWAVTNDNRGIRTWGYRLYVSKDKDLLSSIDYSAAKIDGVSFVDVKVGDLKAGERITATVSNLEFGTLYYATVVGYTYAGVFSASSTPVSVSTKSNNPPVIDFDKSLNFTVKAHETLTFPVSISDPDSHTITVEFTAGSTAAVLSEPDASGARIMTIRGNAATAGSYKFVIKAVDAYGAEATAEQSYVILENHAPVVSKPIPGQLFTDLGEKKTIRIEDFISDPDEETLNYEISIVDKLVAHVNQGVSGLVVTSLGYGQTEVVVKATDACGLSVKATFQVVVKDPSTPVELESTILKDKLVIRTLDEKPTGIRLLNTTGKMVFETTQNVSAFNPAEIDVKNLVPGVYNLEVVLDGVTHKFQVIKI